jgi:hypothetical protein
MPLAFRTALPVLAAISAAACGPGSSAPRACAGDAECPPAARCTAGACVANAPPVPSIALPETPEANALLSFDGSGSADGDPDDGIVSFAWAFRALDAPCAPPLVAGTGPLANVRFACPGRYAVELTVSDRLAATATATRELDVLPRAAALVGAGPDVAVEHVCTSVPTRCTPAEAITLSAAAPDVGSPDLAFEWTVEPPADRPLDAHRRLAFSPDRFASSPTVQIETDGQAISGDWIFRVEARDGAGVVGTAATRVTVGNRPPAVQKTLPVFHHQYDGARFTVQAEIPFTLVDPDGDLVFVPTLSAHQTGAGPGTFSAGLAEGTSAIAVSIAVPYTAPQDALHLIGGGDLARAIALEILDVNGGRVSEVWPVVVANRPPVLVSAPGPITVHHAYDAAADAYTARAELSTWYDPDGDPLSQVPASATGHPACPTFLVPDGSGSRRAFAECRHPAQGGTTLAQFVGPGTLTQRVQDPWGAASATSAVTFAIGNRFPVLSSTAKHVVSGDCGEHRLPCTTRNGKSTTSRDALATRAVLSRWSDPDGDPITYSMTQSWAATLGEPRVSFAPSWPLLLDVQPIVVCESTTFDLEMSASDGAWTEYATIPIERYCPSLW